MQPQRSYKEIIEKSRGFEFIEHILDSQTTTEIKEKAEMIIEKYAHTEESF